MSKNFDIGHTLRHLRNESGFKIKEVVEKLNDLGIENVKDKTLYNYETGFTTPNADVFLELCVIYGCDNPLAWWNKEHPMLSADEKDLVKKYRVLDHEAQSDIVADVTRKYDRIIEKEKESSVSSKVG